MIKSCEELQNFCQVSETLRKKFSEDLRIALAKNDT